MRTTVCNSQHPCRTKNELDDICLVCSGQRLAARRSTLDDDSRQQPQDTRSTDKEVNTDNEHSPCSFIDAKLTWGKVGIGTYIDNGRNFQRLSKLGEAIPNRSSRPIPLGKGAWLGV